MQDMPGKRQGGCLCGAEMHGQRRFQFPVIWFITVKHTWIIEEHTKGISYHEEHEVHEGTYPSLLFDYAV